MEFGSLSSCIFLVTTSASTSLSLVSGGLGYCLIWHYWSGNNLQETWQLSGSLNPIFVALHMLPSQLGMSSIIFCKFKLAIFQSFADMVVFLWIIGVRGCEWGNGCWELVEANAWQRWAPMYRGNNIEWIQKIHWEGSCPWAQVPASVLWSAFSWRRNFHSSWIAWTLWASSWCQNIRQCPCISSSSCRPIYYRALFAWQRYNNFSIKSGKFFLSGR